MFRPTAPSFQLPPHQPPAPPAHSFGFTPATPQAPAVSTATYRTPTGGQAQVNVSMVPGGTFYHAQVAQQVSRNANIVGSATNIPPMGGLPENRAAVGMEFRFGGGKR